MITTILGYSANNKNKNSFFLKDSHKFEQKFIPNFKGIPHEKILNSCERLLTKIDKTDSLENLKNISVDFFDKKLKNIINRNNSKLDGAKADFLRTFGHDLTNKYFTLVTTIKDYNFFKPENVSDLEYLNQLKQKFKDTIDIIKKFTNDWKGDLTEWQNNPNKIIPAKIVFNKLIKSSDIINIEGIEILRGKNVENPFQLYTIIAQPFSNAMKYGEGKPVSIIIEKVQKTDQIRYYASFINHETTPIPNNEIEKILNGNNYRASSAIQKGIKGTGLGFTKIVDILKTNGCDADIPQLIEKGREKGVCVKIPLIGVS